MSETWIGTIPAIGSLLVVLGSWFYMWGGRSGKWKRRFIGALIVASAVWLEYLLMGYFNWFLLLLYPLTIGSFSLGYGADLLPTKILKRSMIVSASITASIGLCLLYGGSSWFILPVEVIVASVTIYLGVKNPIHAASEEFFVCIFLWMPKLIYPFFLL